MTNTTKDLTLEDLEAWRLSLMHACGSHSRLGDDARYRYGWMDDGDEARDLALDES